MAVPRMRRAALLALASIMLTMGLQVSPALAAGGYTGGAGAGKDAAPLYAVNDHTPLGVRWAASGLTPNTNYYLKARFTVDVTPSSSTNRGYTWNPDTQEWVQERASWLGFPVVTTDGTGAIPETWVFVKFGDEAVSGPYHIMISLSELGIGSTFNGSAVPTVTVLDAQAEAGWVHNALATGKSVDSRVEISDPASSTICWTLSRTEGNTVDDDGNLVVDDEDYGPVGNSGDYRLAAPTDSLMDIRFKRTTALADNFTHAYPDCDIAIGAADMVPPSSVGALLAAPVPGGADLLWDEATDADSGVAEYRVYRAEVPEIAGPFTPLASLIATLSAGTRNWTDTDVERVMYRYEVRSVDESGNVGPRSTSTGVTPMALGESIRTFGNDRYATALAVSAASFAPSTVTTVVVATGTKSPDALAASGLAGCFGSPVLLVNDAVTTALTDEIDRLGATDVVLVGGSGVISDSVEDALALDYNVERVFGTDRYSTAAAVADWVAASGGTTETAFIARGDSYADALAAAPFAWSQKMPVLLTKTTEVPLPTTGALESLAIENGIVVGGLAAVPANVYTAIQGALPGTLDRWFGADRYATAVAVAEGGVSRGWGDWHYVGISTGKNFPDALGGGAAAGANGGVMLLTQSDELSAATEIALVAHADDIDLLEVFGGTSAVTTDVYDAITAILP